MSKQKHKAPDEMNGADFATPGGKETHSIVYDLSGRVGRLEGGFVIVVMLLTVVLAMLGLILKIVWGAPSISG